MAFITRIEIDLTLEHIIFYSHIFSVGSSQAT